ncbi:hypothetical protein AVEN_213149-1 [Araneus ventricosus]|uniref:Fibrinogen C-terminal domain-containing protein n=1 Tax=Araneus ventricosus TaxID=182803 RepID=A0A4Y2LT42_ARAVE|nr:hypothetical protein AVEN_213149-1 [Araneus ventricosus]
MKPEIAHWLLLIGSHCLWESVAVANLERSYATRGLFYDAPRSFHQRSDDEDDTSAGALLSKHQHNDVSPFRILFDIQQAIGHGGFWWNRISNLKPSGPEDETLTLGYRTHHVSVELA